MFYFHPTWHIFICIKNICTTRIVWEKNNTFKYHSFVEKMHALYDIYIPASDEDLSVKNYDSEYNDENENDAC